MNLVKKIRRLIFENLQVTVFFLWKTKLDYLISVFLGIVTILYNKNEITKKNRKIGILAIERNIFDEDVKALKKFPSNYQILVFPVLLRALMSDENELIWPDGLPLEQTAFYAKKDDFDWFFDRFSDIFYNTLKFFKSFSCVDIKIILTANIDYFQDYSWIKAIHNKNGKFVVLEKESIVYLSTDKKVLTHRYNKYRFKFDGDVVLFYNYLGKKTYIDTGSVSPNKAFVVGCPRVDSLVSIAHKKSGDGDFVLLASFIEPYYLATNVWDEIIHAVYNDEFLRRKTVVKCKDDKEAKEVKKLFPDINVVSDSIENYFIKNPAILVGYNSTTCYGALIVGIPVVVPYWGETKKDGIDGLVGKHTSSFHLLASSKDELLVILKDYLNKNTEGYKKPQTIWNNLELKKFLEERYSRVDGKNCQRFFEFIDKILT